MSCITILNGITKDCSGSKGGVLKSIFCNKGKALNAGLFTEDEKGGWKLDGSKFPEKSAKVYEPSRETSSFTSTLNVDLTNGTRYVQTEIVLQFNRMDETKRAELNSLLKGDWVVFVEDANKNWYCFGWRDFDFADASSGTGQTGGEKSDGNYYQITLQVNEEDFPTPTDDNDSIVWLNELTND